MQVVYEIRGDIPDSGSRASVLCDAPLTLRKLQILFPFEGYFHYRAKVTARALGLADGDYVWLDITELDAPISCDDNLIEVQALAINLPELSDDDFSDYVEDISHYIPAERQPACEARPPRSTSLSISDQPPGGTSSIFGSHAGGSNTSGSGGFKPTSTLKSIASTVKQTATNINLDTVKSGATSIWNKLKTTAAQLQQQVTSGTEDSAALKTAGDLLALLSKDVNTPFSEAVAYHVQLLEQLWDVQFPDRRYERLSPVWKLAGWQKEDPVADLKNSGLLALHSMIYLGENYPERAQQMLQAQMGNKKHNYPFAIVGVNVTLLLSELFRLREPGLPAVKEPYGPLFADVNAFNEIFCLCFLHIDAVWTQRNAVRTDFGKIIGELKGLLGAVLARGPKSMDEFVEAAAEAGMAIM